ncbi:MAG TPA: ATP-binding cassette domain-containing protein [Candidatus Bathyarchaeia archaeon]|nr:ATP-binding cassette domain-containing protein [Candidatus Bathyarchaeia archaeon]
MIKVRNLHKYFDGQHVLKGINLDIADQEILVILGESGSGKTVLLKHLIGLEFPDEGTVEINGVDITRLAEAELLKVRREIGYLFQEGALYDFFTVRENVAFPLREHTTMTWKDIWAKADHLLEMVGLSYAKDKMPSELSGGMKKRAALARAVVLDSKILLCDEPTSGLDPIRSQEISDLIKEITRQIGSTTVATSHDIHNAFRLADRLVLIRDGMILKEGTARDFQHSDDEFIQKFLSASER